MDIKKLKIIIVGIFVLGLLNCILLYKYTGDKKAERFYKQGIEFYKNEKYSDAYYNFKQIKPFTVFYTASLIKEYQCAILLNDKKTALSRLDILAKIVKDDNIRPYILYNETLLAREANIDSKSVSYKKYRKIMALYPKSDYGIASAYRAAKLIEEKDKQGARDLYIKYLKDAPDGKYAAYALDTLKTSNFHFSTNEYEIMANSYFYNQDYKTALEMYKKTPFEKNWYNISKCHKNLNQLGKEKEVLIEGLNLDIGLVKEQDVSSAVNRLIAITRSNKVQTLQDLYVKSKDKYIFPTVSYLLAENSNSVRSIKLYEYIADNHKDSIWASNSIWEIFWYNYLLGRNKLCEKFAQLHLKEYSNFNDAPRIAYWYGRVLLKEKRIKEAKEIFYKVIKDYPLSYYSFLSARQLKMSKAKKMIVKKPIVEFEIDSINKSIFKDKTLLLLANYGDFETIEDFRISDNYIKSWIAYKKGNYPKTINLIKEKLNSNSTASYDSELEEESEKSEINFSNPELKLMYPILYSDIINKQALEFKQSPYLFLSLVREESHFDKTAKSSVGAVGLAQIMKPTANFIEDKTISGDTLLNEEENIRIGLKYFKYLVEYFKGDESLAILSYNAGPGNINKWLSDNRINCQDIDTFVENIPFPETKNYIKKILSSYWVYINIYSPKNKLN